MNTRIQKCPSIHDVHARINEFHQMNEAFYNSLSNTQVYELRFYPNKLYSLDCFSDLKTEEDEHWQQRSSFNEKQTKLKNELHELEQVIHPHESPSGP